MMTSFQDIKNQVRVLSDQQRLSSIGPLLEKKYADVFADYLGDQHITYALHAISTLSDQMIAALGGLEQDDRSFGDLDVASADVEYMKRIDEQLSQVTQGSKTDLWYESNGRYHPMQKDDYLIMLDDLAAKHNDRGRFFQGLVDYLKQPGSGTYAHVSTISDYVDQHTSPKVSSSQVHRDIQNTLNIVDSQDALGEFQDEINSSHSFDDISVSSEQAQYVKDQGEDLYWDDDDVFTDEAHPLTCHDISDRIEKKLASITP